MLPPEELKNEDSSFQESSRESKNLNLNDAMENQPPARRKSVCCGCPRLFIDFPFRIYLSCLTVFLAFIGAAVQLDMVTPSTPHPRDYLVWKDEKVEGLDAETLLSDTLNEAAEGSRVQARVISPSRWVTQIVYTCECDNIITPENVRQMALLESRVMQLPVWPNLCMATSGNDPGCSSAAYASLASQFLSPHTVNEAVLNATLEKITTEPTYSKIKHLLGANFSAGYQQSPVARALFFLGGPLNIDGKIYKDLDDRREEQERYIIEFGEQIQRLLKATPTSFRADAYSVLLWEDTIRQ